MNILNMGSYGAIDSTAGREDHVSTPPTTNHQVQAAEDQSQHPSASQRLKQFYERNFGLFLVFLAQTCGSVVRGILYQVS